MIGREVQQRSGDEALPAAGEEEIAFAVENLHERATAAGMRGEFLAFGEGEENDAELGALQDGATHDAGGRSVHGLGERERLRVVGREEGAWSHARSVARSHGARLDADQAIEPRRLAANTLGVGACSEHRGAHRGGGGRMSYII